MPESHYDEFLRTYPVPGSERERTLKRYVRNFEALVQGRPLGTITDGDWRNYIDVLINVSGYSPNTTRTALAAVKTLMSWGHEQGYVSREQMWDIGRVKAPKGKVGTGLARPRPYDGRALSEVLRAIEAKYPLATERSLQRYVAGTSSFKQIARHARRLQMEAQVFLMLHAGLRKTETFSVGVVDVHPENESVFVRHAKGDDGFGSQDRGVPMTDTLRWKLLAWLKMRATILSVEGAADPGTVWLCLNPRVVQARNLTASAAVTNPQSRNAYDKCFADLGIEAHRLRHTCATEWLRAGMPIEIVKELMGHSNIKQTLGYLELAPQDLVAAVKRAQAKFDASITKGLATFEESTDGVEDRLDRLIAERYAGASDSDILSGRPPVAA